MIFASAVAQAESKPLPPKFLPLVTYFDVVQGEVYNWWAENQSTGDMSRVNRVMDPLLASVEFISPLHEKKDIPEELKKTELTAEQKQALAQMFQVPVVISGDVYFDKNPLDPSGRRLKIHLQAQHRFKTIGEVWRVVDLHSEDMEKLNGTWSSMTTEHPVTAVFTELVKQIRNRKTPSLNLEMVVSGKLNQPALDRFKKQLQLSVKGLRGVREKSYENEQVALKLDYDGKDMEQFKAALSKTPWRGFKTQFVSSDDKRIFFDVKTEGKQ